MATNWARNLTYQAARTQSPGSPDDIAQTLRRAQRIKALGSTHSFCDIADTPGEHLRMTDMPRRIAVDPAARTVTVDGGVKYGELAVALHEAGFALHNMASLPHISVAGGSATGTHGSGDRCGNLATAVRGLSLVSGAGDKYKFSEASDDAIFAGAVVSLGALGIVTELTLAIEPAFDVWQVLFEHLPVDAARANFDVIMSAGYSVSLFYDWRGGPINQVWLKERVDSGRRPPGSFFGATPANRKLHPIVAIPADSCTEQLGIPGPWHLRLPHFKMEFQPSSGEELQSEYFVAREHAVAAFDAVYALRERIAPLLHIGEVRSIAADNLWLSPHYRRDSIALHFTWKHDWPSVQTLLPELEAALAPFDARPHWGKLFTMSGARIRSLYPRMDDFLALRRRLDPDGRLHNAYLDRALDS
jgi:alditol oxidase